MGHFLPRALRTAVAAAALLLPAAAHAQGWYDIDTPATINFGIPADNLAIGANNISPFTVNLISGFSVNVDLWAYNSATIFLTGGTVGRDIRTAKDTFTNPTLYMSGGTVLGSIFLDSFWSSDPATRPQAGRLFLTGGHVVGSIASFGKASSINVSGGIIDGDVLAFGETTPSNTTKISGGSLQNFQNSGGTADVTGGAISGYFLTNNGARTNWKGGLVSSGPVWVDQGAVLTIYGSNLRLTETDRGSFDDGHGAQIPYINYTLSGQLMDGSPLNNLPVWLWRSNVSKIKLNGTLAGAPNLKLSAGSAFVTGHNTLLPKTTASVTLQNAGNGPATGIVIESISCGFQTASGLNAPLAAIPAGGTATFNHTFDADFAGTLPSTITVRVTGRYNGGTFAFSRRVTIFE